MCRVIKTFLQCLIYVKRGKNSQTEKKSRLENISRYIVLYSKDADLCWTAKVLFCFEMVQTSHINETINTMALYPG